MQKIVIQILLGLLVVVSSRADTPLLVNQVDIIIPGGPCWDDTLVSSYSPPSASNNFTLPGLTGTGTIQSGVSYVVDSSTSQVHDNYTYNLSLSGLSGSGHCISLLIHFGQPLNCDGDVLVETNFGPASDVKVSSATLAPYGDITLQFGTGCLLAGQTATPFGMLTDSTPISGTVTVIDNYTSPNGGAMQSRVNVGAIVPNIPPDWLFPIQLPYPIVLPIPILQGSLVTNPYPYMPSTNGLYRFILQLLDGSNGLAVSSLVTQSVQVVNGLFTTPLPFDPNAFVGNPLWLSMSVSPPNGSNFIPLNPPMPITPAPQAIYAYSAGVVAGLAAGQAVTSLNGLTDAVILQAGSGIIFETNENTLTISSQPGVGSDRSIKTGFMEVKSEDILARLAALPIQSWRYTNEVPSVRHVGPMAQDFKAAFGLGDSEKFIAFVDEQGVALAAIQGLNQKLNEKDAEIQNLKRQNDSLAERLNELETAVKALARK